MRYTLILLICLLSLSGCMPIWVWNYYSPDSSDGTITKSSCQRSVGPPDRLQIIRNEVIIGVRVNDVQDGVLVSIEIEVPAGKEVRLKNLNVSVSSPSLSDTFTTALKHADTNNTFPLKSDESLIGGTREQKLFFNQTRIIYNTYILRANIPMPRTKSIKIKISELIINDKEIMLPAMTFSKDKYVEFFMPINC